MDKYNKNILSNFFKSENLEYKQRLSFIKQNQEFSNYLTEISKLSIKISKMKLNKINYQQDNLINKINYLINKKYLYEKYYKIKNKCEICQDKGIYNGKTCKCLKNIIKNNKLEILNKYFPIKNFSFQNFDINFYSNEIINNSKHSVREKMQKILKYCINYANNFSVNSPNLFITGKTGLGKTHISASIANILADNNFNILYFSLPNLIQIIEEEKFCNKTEFTPLKNELITCDCLILDDLGTEFISIFSISLIYNIINTRIVKKLPIILNTNLNLIELEDKYDERIISRIIGNFIQIKFFGNDIRQKKIIFKNKKGDKNVSI